MSDNLLNLIPTSPSYLPSEEAAQNTVQFLKTIIPSAESITVERNDSPHFIDPGSNLEKITCPACNVQIPDPWWQEAVDIAYTSKFLNLKVTTPCCSSHTSLNDLTYEWPAGFAQFCIRILNPDRIPSMAEIKEVEGLLGTTIRKIEAHY